MLLGHRVVQGAGDVGEMPRKPRPTPKELLNGTGSRNPDRDAQNQPKKHRHHLAGAGLHESEVMSLGGSRRLVGAYVTDFPSPSR